MSKTASQRTRLITTEVLGALRRAWAAAGPRFLIFLVVLTTGLLLLKFTALAEILDRDQLVVILGGLRTVWWAPLALLGFYVVISPLGLPISPLIVAGGVVFGVFWGTVYNVLGTVLGALGSYFLALYLGRDFVEHLTRGRIKKLEDFSVNHAFWPLVRVRFLPVPFPVVNFGAALAGVPTTKFFWAAVVGLMPSMALWTTIWALMYEATVEERYEDTLPLFVLIGVVVVLAAFGPALYKLVRKLVQGPSQSRESESGSDGVRRHGPGLTDAQVRQSGTEPLKGQGRPPQGLP